MSTNEMKTLYAVMFADYSDIVPMEQLQTMLGISRHTAYDLLTEVNQEKTMQ